jgi:PAS domain S-box-containing protein
LEEALRLSEERFRLMVESVQDYAIFMLDPGGHVASWNRGAERIKGYTEEEILGKHFSIFYPPEDQATRFPDHELEVAAREGRFEDEGWRVKKDGSQFWANVVITALYDPVDGHLVGFGKVTRDLTERVKAEGERAALEREREARRQAEDLSQEIQLQTAHVEEQAIALEALNIELQEVNEKLRSRTGEAERARSDAESASRAKSEFLANMSHELRTPINAIIGYADLMELGIAGPLTEGQRDQLARIRVSSEHLLMLIEDILDLSKIEAGRVEIARETGRLTEAVDAALSLIGPQAAARRHEVDCECQPEEGLLYLGDEGRVRQILVNLLSNAVKFTEPGGRIGVSCESGTTPAPGARLEGSGPFVCVTISDTGPGIPPEHQEAVFDPFVQVETGRTRTRGGTGLGLAISRQLARLMGGDLTLESQPGEGSRFTLWLPTPSGESGRSGQPGVWPGTPFEEEPPRRVETGS